VQCHELEEYALRLTAVSFEYQFYLYHDGSLSSQLLLISVMGIVLLFVCWKLFCTRRPLPSTAEEEKDGGKGSTRITGFRSEETAKFTELTQNDSQSIQEDEEEDN
jgi:hypothetical protein